MLAADADTQIPSHQSGEMDPIQHNHHLSKGVSLFFPPFFFVCAREISLTIWRISQVFISVQHLLAFLPILADNHLDMATRLLKGIDDSDRASCLSQNRATRAIWICFATQLSASFDALRAYPGKEPTQE